MMVTESADKQRKILCGIYDVIMRRGHPFLLPMRADGDPRALLYRHAAVIHRDVKTDNIIFFDEGAHDIALFDYDACIFAHDKEMKTAGIGTPNFMAPEAYDGVYTSACDLFSCGCILFSLLHGYEAFDTAEMSLEEAKKSIQEGATISPEVHEKSPAAVDLLEKLLNVDPEERPTAMEALDHPWLQDCLVLDTVTERDFFRRECDRLVSDRIKYSFALCHHLEEANVGVCVPATHMDLHFVMADDQAKCHQLEDEVSPQVRRRRVK
ncbi:unnamed protein product [Vitrella brassicaformis CCMP3155]|uniref:Protein kinase domain-containing protein n=1 Tax=Vitrella brassicaformis (strain CCMP3155) TaxID=1169540 RepID=A0A0G4EID7_VITBC|nr:unnamed protein product [Vitrella brassicaformis CCMP3155]|eukprot:CEL95768.1 unnamed protein product [Vitrella brassicaformis CCMP3155]